MGISWEQHTLKIASVVSPEPPRFSPQILSWEAPVSAFISPVVLFFIQKASFINHCKTFATSGAQSCLQELPGQQGGSRRGRQCGSMKTGAPSDAGQLGAQWGPGGLRAPRAPSSAPPLCPALLISQGPGSWSRLGGTLGTSRGEQWGEGGTGWGRGFVGCDASEVIAA